jgi:hypothetical protein
VSFYQDRKPLSLLVNFVTLNMNVVGENEKHSGHENGENIGRD